MSAEPAAERISRAVVVLVAGASAVVLIVGLRYFSGIIGPLYLAAMSTPSALRGLRQLTGASQQPAVLTNDAPALAGSRSRDWLGPPDYGGNAGE